MNAIERLRQERERLLRRMAEIDSVLVELAAVERRAAVLLGDDALLDGGAQTSSTKSVLGSESSGRRASEEVATFERVAREILSAAEAPLDRTMLYKAVTASGVTIGGKDPKNTLAARVTRMGDVTNIRGKGYWLRSRMGDFTGNTPGEQSSDLDVGRVGDGSDHL